MKEEHLEDIAKYLSVIADAGERLGAAAQRAERLLEKITISLEVLAADKAAGYIDERTSRKLLGSLRDRVIAWASLFVLRGTKRVNDPDEG